MNNKNEKSKDNTLKTFRDDLEAGQELITAIRIIKEISGIKSEDFIDKIIEAMGKIAQTTSKDEFKYCPLSDLKDENNLTKLIKFKCKIQHISDPQRLLFEGSSADNNAINVELVDLNGNTIKAVPIVSEKKKEILQELSKGCSDLCVYGTVLLGLKDRDGSVAKDISNLDYNFFIIDAEETDDLLEVKDLPATGDSSDTKNQSNNGEVINPRSLPEKVDEMSIALRLLLETENHHESGFFKIVQKQIGLLNDSISRNRFNFKKSISEIAINRGIPMLVKFHGSILSLSSTYALRTESDGGFIDDYMATDLTLKDRLGDTIKTIPIVTDKKRAKIQKLSARSSLFCFYGMTSFALKNRRQSKAFNFADLELRFIIMDLEPVENMIEMITANKSEINASRNLIKRINKNQNDILKYIKKQVIENINLKGLDSFPQLDLAVDFLILQSLSGGRIDGGSAKLHSLVIGTPAVGKGKLTQLIYAINQIVREAQGSRLSVTGIAGGGKGDSTPGSIPNAHNGIFIIQDFHSTENKNRILDVLSHVMQEGEIIIAMESQAKHQALTAIHIDMNKISDIYFDDPTKIKSGRYKKLKEIGIPMQILSRFDFIVDIPRDANRQHEIAKEKLGSPVKVGSSLPDGDQPLWSYELKKLVAVLQTDYKQIKISEDVANYMVDKFDALFTDLGSLEMISDFSMRLANSLQKMTAAVCRANARLDATKEDVDYAIRFVQQKVDFLKQVQPEGLQANSDEEKSKSPVELLKEKFAGKEFTLMEAYEFLNNEVEKAVEERQIRNYLNDKKYFEKIKDGRQGGPAKWRA